MLEKLNMRRIGAFVPASVKAKFRPSRRGPLVDKKTWNAEYNSGAWDYLASEEELGRYSVMSGYCRHFRPEAARVLDVGCGTGVLAHWLSCNAIYSYFGIDLSEVAIEQARRSNLPGATFAVADAATFDPSQVFDVIVFNEILYYLRMPEVDVQRFSDSLSPDGIIIVSIWYHADGIRTWERLKARFEELDRVRIVHGPSRQKWDLAVLRPFRR
jgi:2-polyprenyl-3-methyl-5-hydroxy-6-metoxy-1,4-benzoquinol methylase